MGSSILHRHLQIVVPTAWKCARKGLGEVRLIEEVSSSPLALEVGGRGLYGHLRVFINEYGYIRNEVVKYGPHNWNHRIRLIVQGNDDSGKRVWEWGYDRLVESDSVPLSKYWVCGTVPTSAKAKELADGSLAEWAPIILRSGDPVYPKGQELAEWVALFENCEDLDKNGHPALDPKDHDHYRRLADERLNSALRAGVAQQFVSGGKGDRQAADWPGHSYEIGTWDDVLVHYRQQVARINGGLEIIAKIIQILTTSLGERRDIELEKKGIKTGVWPDLNVIEGFSYRQARIQNKRDQLARLVARDITHDGAGSDSHLRAVQLLEGKQEELDRASAVYQRSRGLGVVQLAEN